MGEEVKKQDIEMGFISEVIRSNGMQEAVKQKMTSRTKTKDGFRYGFFKEEGMGERLMDFLFNHYQEHRTTASLETIQKFFPGFELQPYVEPISYWIAELRRRRKFNKLLEGIQKAGISLQQNQHGEEAEKLLVRMISEVQTEINITKDLHWNSEVEDRIADYQQRKLHMGLLGLSFAGIEPLDDATGGITSGQLITISAMPKVGKTWFEVVLVAYWIKQGYNVLFISREMSAKEIARRTDAVFFMLAAEELKLGRLSDMEEAEYIEKLRALKENPAYGQLYVSEDSSKGFGVSAVQAKIEEYNPDVCMIDGSYLLEDEDGGTAMWEKITNITRKLKRTARATGVPIVQSSQISAKAGKEGKANDQSKVSFSQSFAQDSDALFELYRDKDMKAVNKMGINAMLVRDGTNPNVILNWDFADMKNFGSVASVVMDGDDEEDDGGGSILFS